MRMGYRDRPRPTLGSHYARLLRAGGCVVLTAAQPFTTTLINSKRDWFRYDWVIHKTRPTGFLNARKRPLIDHESALVFSPQPPRYYPRMRPSPPRRQGGSSGSNVYGRHGARPIAIVRSFYPRSVLRIDWKRESAHPTEKPVTLAEYMIRTYTRRGQTVLDNTMGRGTTGVAALKLGRRFIGIEKDRHHFAYARRRIEAVAGLKNRG